MMIKLPNSIVALTIAAVLATTGCASKRPNELLDSAKATYERVSNSDVVNQHSTEDLNVAKLKLDSAITAWDDKKSKSEIDKRAYIAEQYALIAEQRSKLLQSQSAIEGGKLMRTNVQMDMRESEAKKLAEKSAALEQQVMLREQQLQQQIAELEELKAMQAKSSDRGMVLTLGDVLFDTNESTLKPDAASNLMQIGSFLNKYPERTLVIEGHTDNTGDAQYNMDLSTRRAMAVKTMLMSQGIASNRVIARGVGENSPVASNSSAEGRQLNRRVDLIFTESDTVTITAIDE
jgi:outer membrane protein OmpA-like peptidoglycan-associated protein